MNCDTYKSGNIIQLEWNTDTYYNVDKHWKHYAKWQKPDTKGHKSYDSIYMKYPKEANPMETK